MSDDEYQEKQEKQGANPLGNLKARLQLKQSPNKRLRHGKIVNIPGLIKGIDKPKDIKPRLKQLRAESDSDEESEDKSGDESLKSGKIGHRTKIIDKEKEKHIDRAQILDRLFKNREVKNAVSINLDVGVVKDVDFLQPILEAPIQELDLVAPEKIKEILKKGKKGKEKKGKEGKDSDEEEDEEDEGKEGKKGKDSDDEDKEGEEESIVPKKKIKIKKPPKTKRIDTGEENIDLAIARIGRKLIINRLPKNEKKYVLKTSSYYMNNRKLYLTKINKLFAPYRKEILDQTDTVTCATQTKKIVPIHVGDSLEPNMENSLQDIKNIDFKLLTHQKIVRDYLNLFTPYRGLLLYHGLGSGKTCTSIAIAEGMKSEKQIFLMTPASLKVNFFSELKKCGDHIYIKNQFWEFISIEGKPEYVAILSSALSLTPAEVRIKKGAWLVDIAKSANYTNLSDVQQKQIDEQLDKMIRSKYTDLNYNGLNMNKIRELTDNMTKNPFDNTVVVIDEAHNFVSRIVNKLPKKPRGPKSKPAIPTVSTILYDYIMSATDCRVVLLTGTPIINYPNELGVMYNMLRGYIKTWVLPVLVSTDRPINRDTILDMFHRENFNTYDYVKYSDNKLTITRNPFGFVNTEAKVRGGKKSNKPLRKSKKLKKSYKLNNTKKISINNETQSVFEEKDGVIKIKTDKLDTRLDPIFIEEYRQYQNGTEDNEPHQGGGGAFEDYDGVKLDVTGNMSDDDFLSAIIHILKKNGIKVVESNITQINNKALPDDSETFMNMFIEIGATKMKNEDLFKRRILGCSSYFRSAQEQLLPNYVENEEGGFLHMERIEMSDYQFGIYEKIRKAEEEERQRNAKKANRQKAKGEDDLFGVSSSYRIFSRACCNFAFPDPPGRPMPDRAEKEGVEDTGLKEGKPKVKKIVKPRAKKAVENLGEVVGEKKVEKVKRKYVRKPKLDKTGDQVGGYIYDSEEGYEYNSDSDDQEGGENSDSDDEDTGDNTGELDEEEFDAIANVDDNGEVTEAPNDYQRRITAALKMLEYNPSVEREEEYLTPTALTIYSPKFKRILENLQDTENVGLHLLYTNFRTIEGVGILKLILEANGFEEFKIEKIGATWSIKNYKKDVDVDVDVDADKDVDADAKVVGKSRFVLYTGTESTEEKEIIRNIYNSNWDYVPASIVEQLGQDANKNLYGNTIKILMITASGAEGINLKNTRFVHIVEPYWHMVRIEQVIGRARRICSHEDLPVELRNIKVFVYCSTLSEAQKTDEKHIELRIRDVSKIDGTPITTDEALYESAVLKDRINQQLLTAIKETAMDCSLYAPTNKSENLVCYGFGKVNSNQFSSYPMLGQDADEKDEINEKKEKLALKKFAINKKDYFYDKDTDYVYDFETVNRAKKTGEDLLIIGRLKRDKKGAYIDTTDVP